MMPWVPGMMGFCYIRGHKDTQSTSMLWHERKGHVKWEIKLCSKEISMEKTLLASGIFFNVSQQEKTVLSKLRKKLTRTIEDLS